MKAWAAAALAACLVAACGGHRPYAADHARNLSLRTSVHSDSTFSSMKAAVDVYSVDAQCRAQLEGRVALDGPLVEVGIPEGRASLLVFEFAGSGFLGGQRSVMSKHVSLTPRPGRRYEARVDYKDSIYNIEVREIDPRTGASREVDIRSRC